MITVCDDSDGDICLDIRFGILSSRVNGDYNSNLVVAGMRGCWPVFSANLTLIVSVTACGDAVTALSAKYS